MDASEYHRVLLILMIQIWAPEAAKGLENSVQSVGYLPLLHSIIFVFTTLLDKARLKQCARSNIKKPHLYHMWIQPDALQKGYFRCILHPAVFLDTVLLYHPFIDVGVKLWCLINWGIVIFQINEWSILLT